MPKVRYNSAEYFNMNEPDVGKKHEKSKEFQMVLAKARKKDAENRVLKEHLLAKLAERRAKKDLDK